MIMTTKQARKVLGKQASGISEEELEKDIEMAELLKNLFFVTTTSKQKASVYSRLRLHNVP